MQWFTDSDGDAPKIPNVIPLTELNWQVFDVQRIGRRMSATTTWLAFGALNARP